MHLQNNTFLQGGKYKIVRFIASGGFGCTYEAWHTQLDARIALKEFFLSLRRWGKMSRASQLAFYQKEGDSVTFRSRYSSNESIFNQSKCIYDE